MDTSSFIESLPAGWATAPIYRKGVLLPNGKSACGKSPLGRAHRENLAPKATLHYLTENPDTFGAIGVFSGPRSQGLVILDIDERLAMLERKYSADLQGPHILSTKRNAAKFLFVVPRELWTEVSDVSLAASGAGFEILWGRQAVIAGAYAGGGHYEVHGDFGNLPEAPEWLLEHMRESRRVKVEGQSQAKLTDNRYSLRSKEERIVIAQSCLSVIPHQGRGSEDVWWRIGAAIHSELPDEEGLHLWSTWSRGDSEYASDWENGGDPCYERWVNFKADKGIGFGSLIKLADQFDPERARFQRDGCEQIISEIEAQTLTIKEAVVTFAELYDRADEIFSNLDMSTAERRFKLMALGARAGIRVKPVQEVTEMYLGEREKRMGKVAMRTAVDRYDNPAEASYFVPGILCSGVWLVSGRGNSGKTNAAWRFAKHFLSGRPLPTTDGLRSWEKGPVLWLSGDQPDAVMDDQIKTHLTREECENLHIENNFNINDYPSFLLMAQKYKPKFVVIDSLRSCHRGTGVTENDSEFALPLRWYEQMMGQPGMFENCMIFVIHHSGHGRGGARGTSALGDMTSFTADFDVPGKDSNFSPLTTRVMTLRKHRFGLKDHQMLVMLQDDGTVQLNYIGIPAEKTASSVQDRVRLKMHRSPKERFTVEDLANSPHVAGSKEAVRKALQRLIRHGLAVKASGGKGRITTYQADGVVAGFSSKGEKAPNKIVPAVSHSSETQSTTGETECDDPCPTTPMSHLHTSIEDSLKSLDE